MSCKLAKNHHQQETKIYQKEAPPRTSKSYNNVFGWKITTVALLAQLPLSNNASAGGGDAAQLVEYLTCLTKLWIPSLAQYKMHMAH